MNNIFKTGLKKSIFHISTTIFLLFLVKFILIVGHNTIISKDDSAIYANANSIPHSQVV